MSLITFPSSPSLYQTFTVGSKTWIWNGSAWDLQLANTTTLTAFTNSAFTQANSAFIVANGAFIQANAAYQSQNTTGSYANSAFGVANNASSNTVLIFGIDATQNTNITSATNSATAAFIQANSAFIQANLAYTEANSSAIYANGAFAQANASYQSQNTTGSYANSAFGVANSAGVYANGAFAQANASFGVANTAASNTVLIFGIDATQNSSITAVTNNTTAAFIQANSAFAAANTAASNTVLIFGIDATQNSSITAAFIQANLAYTQSNSSAIYANGAFTQANAAYQSQNTTGSYANSAFGVANTASSNTVLIFGIDATQNTNITSVTTTATAAFTQANAAFTVANSASSNTILTQGVDTTQNTNITAVTNNTTAAFIQANASFTVANSASSNTILTQGVDTTQNTNITAAFIQANSAYQSQNTTGSYANSAFTVANGAAFVANTDYTTISATVGVYGGTTAIPVITLAANGRISSISNTSFTSGGVTSVTGTSPVVSSGGTTPAISLAAGYGDTQNPYASKTANYFLAAPNGSAGVPTFRAIVAADIPTLNQSTTGSAGSVANALTFSTGLVVSSGTTYNGSAAITLSIPQAITTTSSVQFGSFGVGTAASGTTGEIRATNNITAYYSDDRLKTRFNNIDNALAKVLSLNGFYYQANETAQALGYQVKSEVGVSAQEVQAILPEIVVPAPIDDKYLTVHYDKLIPLLIEAIKEQQKQIDDLKSMINIQNKG